MSGKDRITCHVLDTTAGRPAKGIRVRLEGPCSPANNSFSSSSSAGAVEAPSSSPPGNKAPPAPIKAFESQTDDDGRVRSWLPYSSETSSGEVPIYTLDDVLGEIKGPSRWTLRFDTASYFGGEHATFFPEATVVFRVEEGGQYHVPLLLSPYSYTTYRGS
ncbi:putative 5-hydroxyisourate hydrolase [Escovopsis weberi]|uniref:Putative 5-hydroxyisourate hydrolase n=1 Tax=Escovopsis weberi TaxID=150374 RepID=A0A0M8N1V4_ESCWE|nr:putative 5-hydroxyisourate hydrolase [Escovopsis weberi]